MKSYGRADRTRAPDARGRRQPAHVRPLLQDGTPADEPDAGEQPLDDAAGVSASAPGVCLAISMKPQAPTPTRRKSTSVVFRSRVNDSPMNSIRSTPGIRPALAERGHLTASRGGRRSP